MLFSYNIFLVFSLLLTYIKNKEKNPPVPLWDKTLSEYFSTHNSSNYIDIEPKICLNNESY